MSNMGVASDISLAIQNRLIIEIVYNDKNGNTTKRRTEPYEIKGNKYYGYCLNKNSIRSFDLGGIRSVEVTNSSFTPRWN